MPAVPWDQPCSFLHWLLSVLAPNHEQRFPWGSWGSCRHLSPAWDAAL